MGILRLQVIRNCLPRLVGPVLHSCGSRVSCFVRGFLPTGPRFVLLVWRRAICQGCEPLFMSDHCHQHCLGDAAGIAVVFRRAPFGGTRWGYPFVAPHRGTRIFGGTLLMCPS